MLPTGNSGKTTPVTTSLQTPSPQVSPLYGRE